MGDEVPVRRLDDALTFVEGSEDQIRDLGVESLKAANGELYPYDLLVASAASRAILISKGFRTLMNERNYVASYPLVRLAMDCCLCLVAGHFVDDLNDYANHVVAGGRLSSYKSKDGDRLTDAFLRNKLHDKYPDLNVNGMYKQCSSWVHMSSMHIHSATHQVEDGDNDATSGMAIRVSIGGVKELSESEYIEATLSLAITNAMLCQMIAEWHNTKMVRKAETDKDFEGRLYHLPMPVVTKYVRSP
ncbi:MAG: hypothetical protein OXH68_21185 [Gammaproteobacteria bacterium]|nr:hypothetical protein [Gammaproteobacteria bacterium]